MVRTDHPCLMVGRHNSVDFLARKLELMSRLMGDGPAIDRHDHLLPKEGHHALSTRVSLGLLALGESSRGHKAFHHGALFELMFDGVHMVQIGYFEKFLKVLIRLSCLALDVVLSGSDLLLIGVIRFLVVIVAAGSSSDPWGCCFCPLFAIFGTFLSVFACGFGRFPTAANRDHFLIALNKDDPDRLFARSMLSGDIKQLLGGLWLIATEFMH
jgi:hypothetical protein